ELGGSRVRDRVVGGEGGHSASSREPLFSGHFFAVSRAKTGFEPSVPIRAFRLLQPGEQNRVAFDTRRPPRQLGMSPPHWSHLRLIVRNGQSFSSASNCSLRRNLRSHSAEQHRNPIESNVWPQPRQGI